jgi:catechol 2,3-dioxygenase-like lactoylglutathione lyase family enzyme
MEFLRIKETCLYVRDLGAAKDFYNGLLGLEVISYLEGKHLFLRTGQSVLLFFNPDDSKTKTSPPPHYGGGKQHFAFEVEKNNYEKAKSEI